MAESPYFYTYDAAGLTDGQSYRNLSVELRDRRPFLLRRLAGLDTVAAKLQLYYPGRSNAPVFSRPQRLGSNYLLAPELAYDGAQTIFFDVETVARQTSACASTIYTSRLTFQGARPDAIDLRPAGKRPLPFVRHYSLVLDWYRYVSLPAAAVEPIRYRAIDIDNYDFELQRISILDDASGDPVTTEFALELYDSTGDRLSNGPVLAGALNYLANPAAGWCTPGVVYPMRRQLRFGVESLLCNTAVVLPRTYTIAFEGVQWV